MIEEKNIFSYLKHFMCYVMVSGLLFLSSVQVVATVFDVNISQNITSSEEENEEEHSDSEVEQKKIEPDPPVLPSFNGKFITQKPIIKTENSVLDFILEIQIPPPDVA